MGMTLGPDGQNERVLRCPGCERWQLHYSLSSVEDLIVFRMVGGRPAPDTRRVDALIEFLLGQHVKLECKRPDVVHALWKLAGRPA